MRLASSTGWRVVSRPKAITEKAGEAGCRDGRNPARSYHPGLEPGNTPVFAGTQVPVRTLFDYLEAGDPLDKFLEQYPGVAREQAVEVLEMSRQVLLPDDEL